MPLYAGCTRVGHAIFLCLLICLSIGLSACGNGNGDESVSSPPTKNDSRPSASVAGNELAVEGLDGSIVAASSVVGLQPAPTPFTSGATYQGRDVRRLTGGGLQGLSNRDWVGAVIDGGACTNKVNEATFTNLTDAQIIAVDFCSVQATTGWSKQSYILRLDRSDPSSAWNARIFVTRHNNSNNARVLDSKVAVIPANASSISVKVHADTTTIGASLFAAGKPAITLSALDSQYRGNHIGVHTFTQNNPAVWTWRYGVGGGGSTNPGTNSTSDGTVEAVGGNGYDNSIQAAEGLDGSIVAASSVVGLQPAPTPFTSGATYQGRDVRRLTGGGLQGLSNRDWVGAVIDGGACTNKVNEATFTNLTDAQIIAVDFCSVQATTGWSKQSYILRLDRSDPSSAWNARIFVTRHNNSNNARVLDSKVAVIPANASSISVKVHADTTTIGASLFAAGKPAITLSALDSQYRGNHIGVHTFTQNNPAVWTWRYGVGGGDPATPEVSSVSPPTGQEKYNSRHDRPS